MMLKSNPDLFKELKPESTHLFPTSTSFKGMANLRHLLILTWHRGDRDREGGSPRARPLHCTTVGLTLAIIPNVDDSGAQFLLGGDCVRAIP